MIGELNRGSTRMVADQKSLMFIWYWKRSREAEHAPSCAATGARECVMENVNLGGLSRSGKKILDSSW